MQSTAEAPSTIRRDLNAVLDRQRAAFLRDGPPSLAQRRTNLKRLRTAIVARKQALAEAFDADFGHRSSQESSILELLTLIWGIDYLHAHVRRFMRPTHKHVAWPVRFATARIEYQPLGVVGIIAPWNYPLSLALMPLATALAAGNQSGATSPLRRDTGRRILSRCGRLCTQRDVPAACRVVAGGAQGMFH